MSHRIKLGRSGLLVSPVCFGTWQMSPFFWGDVSHDAILAAIEKSLDVDVNFFDTADAYGNGIAETVLGRGIKSLPRDKIVIATKVYHHVIDQQRRYGDLSHDYILEAAEASLKRLQTDYIDLYQLHAFDPLARVCESVDALEKLIKQGKIRSYGLSNWSAEQMRLAHRHGNFSTCQPPYSLLRREIENDVLPYCQANDMGVLVYSPLQKGLLSGKYRGDEIFNDSRKKDPQFQGERFKQICDAVALLKPIAEKYQLNIAQLVLATTLEHPDVDCVIVGVKESRHIEEAAGIMGKNISREDWNTVRNLVHA